LAALTALLWARGDVPSVVDSKNNSALFAPMEFLALESFAFSGELKALPAALHSERRFMPRIGRVCVLSRVRRSDKSKCGRPVEV
jgi:hypothetical protein